MRTRVDRPIMDHLLMIKHFFVSSSHMCFILSDLKWSTTSSSRNHLCSAKEKESMKNLIRRKTSLPIDKTSIFFSFFFSWCPELRCWFTNRCWSQLRGQQSPVPQRLVGARQKGVDWSGRWSVLGVNCACQRDGWRSCGFSSL